MRALIALGVTPEDYRVGWEASFEFCSYLIAWFGPCGRNKKAGTQAVERLVLGGVQHYFCARHTRLYCVVCGDRAIKECDGGVAVPCGQPLCSRHRVEDHHA